MNRIKPILRWAGNKGRLLPRLLPKIKPHEFFGDVFCGSGAVILAKERSRSEAINDINGDLVKLYRNVQFHLPELLRELQFMVGSRSALKDFLAQPGLTDIQRAARFLVRNQISFAGNCESFGVAKSGPSATLDRGMISDRLHAIRDRLDRVRVENLPYERFIELYDGPESFFFLDPPYVGDSIRTYAPWTQADMTGLRKVLNRVKGDWLLTVNASDANRELFADCQIETAESKSRMAKNGPDHKSMFSEFIIAPK